jgi:hypothetical protein
MKRRSIFAGLSGLLALWRLPAAAPEPLPLRPIIARGVRKRFDLAAMRAAAQREADASRVALARSTFGRLAARGSITPGAANLLMARASARRASAGRPQP